MAKLKLALFGGTFDPVHHGHLIGARDVLEQLKLDLVVFVPTALSPHKLAQKPTAPEHRLGMLRAAIKGQARFWASRLELDRPAPSYAIDTVNALRAGFPGSDLFWILGADQLPLLRTWERFSELKKLVTFVVLGRQGGAAQRLPKGIVALPRPRRIDISATEIRRRVARKLPIEHLVPAGVARYIARTRLYSA